MIPLEMLPLVPPTGGDPSAQASETMVLLASLLRETGRRVDDVLALVFLSSSLAILRRWTSPPESA